MQILKSPYSLFLSLFALFFLAGYPAFSEPGDNQEEVLNAVIATVNKEPITLFDLRSLHSTPDKISFSNAGKNKEAQQILGLLISNQLVREEAKSRKINVRDSEVETYIKRIAERNNLSAEEFEEALVKENKTLAVFKEHSKIEILRSKLSNQMFQEGVGVSEKDINNFVKEHPEFGQAGEKVKLRQIFISRAKSGKEGAEKLIDLIHKRLVAGEDFGQLAKQYSDSPESAHGGFLGMFSTDDLSPMISKAIQPLKSGEFSSITYSPQGFHIFMVEQKFSGNAEQLRIEAKKIIKQQHLNMKLHTFFTTELYKLHSVERKI